MITPQETRQRAQTLVGHYADEYECHDLTDVKHILTVLTSATIQAIAATNRKAAVLQVLVNILIHTVEHDVPYRTEATTEGGLHITVDRKY